MVKPSLGAENYDVLSDKGVRQAQILGEYLLKENISFDKIFVGPLDRQIDTFKAVEEQYRKNEKNLPTPIIIKGLKEHNGHRNHENRPPRFNQNRSLFNHIRKEHKARS